MEKILCDLNNFKVNMNSYFEDSCYQRLIDSEFSSIIERLKWHLREEERDSVVSEIEKSLISIENISGQISYLINIIEHELSHCKDRPISATERFSMASDISIHLQDKMVTSDINSYLSAFNIETENVSIVPSKRVYVQDLLKKVDSEIIAKIATDLGLKKSKNGVVCSKTFTQLIQERDLKSILSDFERALQGIESDPDLAIASSSSTLESIFKSILELEGVTLPKKKSISNLLSETSKLVNLNPKDHDNAEIKRVLGGIQNVILGIGALRTGYSSAHGHGIKRYSLSRRHVRVLVNSMVTYGTFILETYIEKIENARAI